VSTVGALNVLQMRTAFDDGVQADEEVLRTTVASSPIGASIFSVYLAIE
jgi:hypothetical protein